MNIRHAEFILDTPPQGPHACRLTAEEDDICVVERIKPKQKDQRLRLGFRNQKPTLTGQFRESKYVYTVEDVNIHQSIVQQMRRHVIGAITEVTSSQYMSF